MESVRFSYELQAEGEGCRAIIRGQLGDLTFVYHETPVAVARRIVRPGRVVQTSARGNARRLAKQTILALQRIYATGLSGKRLGMVV